MGFFALLFNKNMPDTMQLKRIPLNILPSITYISEPYQLYVSQYSINSALYTLSILFMNPLPIYKNLPKINNFLSFVEHALF